MSPTKADIADRRWEVCRRCRHYRVEHSPTRRRCRAEVPSEVAGQEPDPCGCSGFDPPR